MKHNYCTCDGMSMKFSNIPFRMLETCPFALRPTSKKCSRMELDLDLNHVSMVQTSFPE
jgi:hypothetical protein